MYYLITLPIIFVAVIIHIVADRYELKIFEKISKLIIIVFVLIFIYTFLDYNNINLFNIVKDFFSF